MNAPYYTAAEAVGRVRGWLSDQDCLAVLEQKKPTWAASWAGDHWIVTATFPEPKPPYLYEWWERTWAVVNPNDCC